MSDGKVEYKDVTVKVSKETFEVWEALVEVVKQAKLAGKDGFQAVADVPAVLLGSLNKLSSAVNGLNEIPEEVKLGLPAFIQANGTGAGLIGALLVSKDSTGV